MPTDPDLWSHKNLTDIIWYLDPDQVARFFGNLVEREKDVQSESIDSLFDLIDVDKCPKKYLMYLAAQIGVKLYHEDREESWRAQIRSAVQWYKEKGKIDSFTILFRTMGMNPEIYPLWINEKGHVEREPLDPSYKPHARIDLVIREYPEWKRYLPEKLQYVLNRMEEVRPIHVLLRGIFLGWDFFDIYPFDLIEDDLKGTVYGYPSDYWCSAYWAQCGIWHFPEDMGIYRDGGGYAWQYPKAQDYTPTPPLTPTEGDRYLVGSGATGDWAGHDHEIADYSGGSWVFTTPSLNDAIWVTYPPSPTPHPNGDPGGYKAYFFNATDWYQKWELFDLPRRRPGPFFRECKGPLEQGGCGPVDEYEMHGRWAPEEDPWGYCLYHDGYIQLRDGTHMHNCREFADLLKISQGYFSTDDFPDTVDAVAQDVGVSVEDSAFPGSQWDQGQWDAPGRTWDQTVDDELEINVIPVGP